MTIILDENLPFGLRRMLAPRVVTTVQLAGFAGMKNGPLLAALDQAFDVFVTADKNLRYQQNLRGRHLGIVELPTNRWPLLRPLESRIISAVDSCQPGAYVIVDFIALP
jgi:hypothetical protein